MKQTPFHTIHRQLGAKMVPFGGYEMPVQYTSIIEEHNAVREAVGVFDTSHMGEFVVKGKKAEAFLQRVTVNDVAKLVPGEAQYSAMCYDDAGIVDDLLVYRIKEDHFMVVVNASNTEKDFEWMSRHLMPDVEFVNASDATALLAIQGPQSCTALQRLTSVDLKSIPYYRFREGTLSGVDMIISRTGYTGELGYELYFSPSYAENVWQSLFKAGKDCGMKPVGLGARDTLRLEMGYCLYGNDIDQTTNTLEAGLGWITKLKKGDFIGRPVLEKVKAQGVKRKLVGVETEEKSIPRHGYAINSNGTRVGSVTSGTFSPSLEKGIALGYVDASVSSVGSPVNIDVRGKMVQGKITPLPFLKKKDKN
ncbi:MAG: glycine cleavage system aminomethyltransferase GcvT [Bacteroidota bacterium]